MKIELAGDEFTVKLRARTWERAGEVTAHIRANPPDGYRLIDSLSSRVRGRRCPLVWTFEYCDDRVQRFTLPEAHEWFSDFEAMAQLRLAIPPICHSNQETSAGNASREPSQTL